MGRPHHVPLCHKEAPLPIFFIFLKCDRLHFLVQMNYGTGRLDRRFGMGKTQEVTEQTVEVATNFDHFASLSC